MKTKEQQLENLFEKVYCRLAPSKIHGVGVFAIRQIPKGFNPLQEERELEIIEVSGTDFSRLSAPLQGLVRDMCPENNGMYEMPNYSLNEIGISYYLNHSKNPNMATDDGGDFYSLREIQAGEELTVDYETYGELNLG